LGQQGLQDWAHAISIAQHLPGIRFNSVGSVIGSGLLATAVSIAAAGIAMVIGRVAAREGPELPIAAGLSGSLLASPYLSVTDLAALLIAAWLVLRLDPPGWLTVRRYRTFRRSRTLRPDPVGKFITAPRRAWRSASLNASNPLGGW